MQCFYLFKISKFFTVPSRGLLCKRDNGSRIQRRSVSSCVDWRRNQVASNKMCEMLRTREISNSVWLSAQEPEKQEHPKGVLAQKSRDGGAGMSSAAVYNSYKQQYLYILSCEFSQIRKSCVVSVNSVLSDTAYRPSPFLVKVIPGPDGAQQPQSHIQVKRGPAPSYVAAVMSECLQSI